MGAELCQVSSHTHCCSSKMSDERRLLAFAVHNQMYGQQRHWLLYQDTLSRRGLQPRCSNWQLQSGLSYQLSDRYMKAAMLQPGKARSQRQETS